MIPKRLGQALQKLYSAYNSGSLNPECCKQCAVGNIMDQTESWKYLTDQHGSLKLSYVGSINEAFGKKFNGYSPSELLQIEAEFLKGCGYQLPLHHGNKKPKINGDKDILFEGLSATVSFLCALDNIQNVMSIQKLVRKEHNSILEML
ncbi:Na(+)-translocating NADH-quinone reductase subunit F [Aegicerativicinus sediminis]